MYSLSQADMQMFFKPSTFPDSNVNNYEQRIENDNDSDEYSSVISLFSSGSPKSSNNCGDNNEDDSNDDSCRSNDEHFGCDNCDSSDRIMSNPCGDDKRVFISIQTQPPWIGNQSLVNSREDCTGVSASHNSTDSRISADIRRKSEDDGYRDMNIGAESTDRFYNQTGVESSGYSDATNNCLETAYTANSLDLDISSAQTQRSSGERSSCRQSKEERNLRMKSKRDRFLAFDGKSIDESSSKTFASAIEIDMDYSSGDFYGKGGARDIKSLGGIDDENKAFRTRIQHTENFKNNIPLTFGGNDRFVKSTRHVLSTSELCCDDSSSSSLLVSSPLAAPSSSTASIFTTHSTISLSQLEQPHSMPLDTYIGQSCGFDFRFSSGKHEDFYHNTPSAKQSDVCDQRTCNILDIDRSHPSMSALYSRYPNEGSYSASDSRHSVGKLKSTSIQLHSCRCNASLHDPIIRNQI